MILDNVREMWVEIRLGAKENKRRLVKDHYFNTLFVRDDSLIMVLKNPQ